MTAQSPTMLPVLAAALAVGAVLPLIALAFSVSRLVSRHRLRHRLRTGATRGLAWLAGAEVSGGRGAWWIDVLSEQGRRHSVARDVMTIGSSEDCDIHLDDTAVEAWHAVIRRAGPAAFELVDVTGMPGGRTLVNGRARTRAVLAPGDLIVVGGMRLALAGGPGQPSGGGARSRRRDPMAARWPGR